MKYRYSINNDNQLLIKPARQKKTLVAGGRFVIDKKNQLVYWLNTPSPWQRKYGLPNKITFTGNWRLNPNYDLELILDETKTQFKDDRLALKGELISVDRDELAFEIKGLSRPFGSFTPSSANQKGGTVPIYVQLLRLSGSWQADEHNCLSFIVKKKALPDVLTLEGAWQLNQNQQIVYTYEKTGLKRKTKTSQALTFEGFWQINEANKLTYIISRSSKSRFDFRVQAESPNLYPREGVIKYRIGIGLKGLSPKGTVPKTTKIISLFGVWKFSRKLGLIFEMDYGKGRARGIEFGTEVSLNRKDEVIFSVKAKSGEPVGFNVTFTRRFLSNLDAEAFLRFKQLLKKETAVEAGVHIPF